MTHGSLFSGIGGFELGAKQAGIDTLWNCEILPYNRQILKQHFPESKQYEDITKLSRPESVDIISGGFPCQDISVAGKGEGIKGSRSGLWSEMFRIIGELRPKYIIIENSPALLVRGFERVLLDLSEIGYNAEWQCLQTSDFGMPHQRERVYVIAYSNSNGLQRILQEIKTNGQVLPKSSDKIDLYTPGEWLDRWGDSNPVRGNNGIPNRSHRIKSLGNSVSPIVAKYLFECIKNHSAV